MQSTETKQTFLLPKSISEQASIVHASCYRLSLSMLRRAEHEMVCVPIDSLNLKGLITDSAIFFADTHEADTEAGKINGKIKISWHLHLAEERDINEQHIPMKVIFYDNGLENLQQQITGEYYRALMLMDESYRNNLIPSGNIQIISP